MNLTEAHEWIKNPSAVMCIETDRIFNWLIEEVIRLEIALSETEELWRKERQLNRMDDEEERVG